LVGWLIGWLVDWLYSLADAAYFIQEFNATLSKVYRSLVVRFYAPLTNMSSLTHVLL
jgi:hypothetical protein